MASFNFTVCIIGWVEIHPSDVEHNFILRQFEWINKSTM